MTKTIPLESEITRGILRYLKTLEPHGWFFKVHGGAWQSSGVPDIIGVYRGRFVGFEVKRPRVGRLTLLQAAVIGKINAAGGLAAVVYGLDDVRALLKQLEVQDG